MVSSRKLTVQAHDAPILHLSFAHPIHGSLLATCSHDRTVRIWEELPLSNAAATAPRWAERGILAGAKGSVRAVEFAPPNPSVGMRVGSIATDGHLRIHTSLDPELSDWSLQHDVHVPSLSAVEEGGAFPPVTVDGAGANELSTGGWGLSWCRERWWGSVLAAFSGTSPAVKIIQLDPQPRALAVLKPQSTSPLTSVAWAPSCGRSYHLVATGARDGTVRIWQLSPPEDESGKQWSSEMIAEFPKGARVSMVAWNATGTTLTTSDDEGVIRIYKRELFQWLL